MLKAPGRKPTHAQASVDPPPPRMRRMRVGAMLRRGSAEPELHLEMRCDDQYPLLICLSKCLFEGIFKNFDRLCPHQRLPAEQEGRSRIHSQFLTQLGIFSNDLRGLLSI